MPDAVLANGFSLLLRRLSARLKTRAALNASTTEVFLGLVVVPRDNAARKLPMKSRRAARGRAAPGWEQGLDANPQWSVSRLTDRQASDDPPERASLPRRLAPSGALAKGIPAKPGKATWHLIA